MRPRHQHLVNLLNQHRPLANQAHQLNRHPLGKQPHQRAPLDSLPPLPAQPLVKRVHLEGTTLLRRSRLSEHLLHSEPFRRQLRIPQPLPLDNPLLVLQVRIGILRQNGSCNWGLLTGFCAAFGAQPAGQAPAFGTSAFGQTSAFGSTSQPTQPAFGAPAQASAFGKPAQSSAFGTPAVTSSSTPFGQSSAPAFGSSPFGQAASQPNTAGASANIDYADSIPKEEDISPSDLAAFKADMFDVLQIPLVQPPLSVR